MNEVELTMAQAIVELNHRAERIAELVRDEAYWRGEYHKLSETPKGQIEDEREQLHVDIEGVGGYKDRIAELERNIDHLRDKWPTGYHADNARMAEQIAELEAQITSMQMDSVTRHSPDLDRAENRIAKLESEAIRYVERCSDYAKRIAALERERDEAHVAAAFAAACADSNAAAAERRIAKLEAALRHAHGLTRLQSSGYARKVGDLVEAVLKDPDETLWRGRR